MEYKIISHNVMTSFLILCFSTGLENQTWLLKEETKLYQRRGKIISLTYL